MKKLLILAIAALLIGCGPISGPMSNSTKFQEGDYVKHKLYPAQKLLIVGTERNRTCSSCCGFTVARLKEDEQGTHIKYHNFCASELMPWNEDGFVKEEEKDDDPFG